MDVYLAALVTFTVTVCLISVGFFGVVAHYREKVNKLVKERNQAEHKYDRLRREVSDIAKQRNDLDAERDLLGQEVGELEQRLDQIRRIANGEGCSDSGSAAEDLGHNLHLRHEYSIGRHGLAIQLGPMQRPPYDDDSEFYDPEATKALAEARGLDSGVINREATKEPTLQDNLAAIANNDQLSPEQKQRLEAHERGFEAERQAFQTMANAGKVTTEELHANMNKYRRRKMPNPPPKPPPK